MHNVWTQEVVNVWKQKLTFQPPNQITMSPNCANLRLVRWLRSVFADTLPGVSFTLRLE